VSPLHLLYMGYSIVVNFVEASACRFSIHNCGLLQANLLNGILIPEVEVADPEFLLLDHVVGCKQVLCFVLLFHLMRFLKWDTVVKILFSLQEPGK
jgi:hypothetical protein